MTRRITFVLPGHGANPIGGYKVVYEYANCLSSRGYDVNIVHPTRLYTTRGLTANALKYFRYVERGIDKSYLPSKWFNIEKAVNVLWVPSLHERNIPDSDVIVATFWKTAEWVAGYSPRKGEKYYLIQHFEEFGGPPDQVLATWRLPLHKIVISRWLARIAESEGETSTYIPNGLDFAKFELDVPLENRDPRALMMLYHDEPWKGSRDGLDALRRVKKEYPDVRTIIFGVPSGRKLPDWVEYHRKPKQDQLRRLYNRSSIFVAPSWAEGWGLPAAESMMCGDALVATDIGGHREFAEHGKTALLSPARDPQALARNIMELIEDTDKRIKIARAAHENIQQFTWKRACDRLEHVFAGADE